MCTLLGVRCGQLEKVGSEELEEVGKWEIEKRKVRIWEFTNLIKLVNRSLKQLIIQSS